MPQTVNSLIDRIKTTCDNNTFLFVFASSPAVAYNKNILFEKWETRILSMSYYNELPAEKKETMLVDGIYAYDEQDTDYISGNLINPAVYKYVITKNSDGTILNQRWVKTKYTASKNNVVNSNGVTETYFSYKNENDTYYNRKIMKRMISGDCVNIYYKNSIGKWVDYNKYINLLPNYELDTASINWPDVMKINTNIIPSCTYIDENGYVYEIDENDGENSITDVTNIELNTNDNSVVSYEPANIDDLSLAFTYRHLMNDLKITIPSKYNKFDFLVWLNGSFVPTTLSSLGNNIFYIEKALSMIGSKCVNQILHAPIEHGNNATVVEKESNNEYRYDVNLRFFGWEGVKVSDFYKPVSSETVPITYNYSSVHPIKSVEFPTEINKDAYVILCNGKILDENEYILDPTNPRRVTFKNIESEAYILLNEIVKDISENISFYENVNPLKMIGRVITSRNYSLINFESTNENKRVRLLRSKSLCVNFPYKNEVTFTSLSSGDLVLVNGLYTPYEIIHKNTIRFPRLVSTYNDGVIGEITEKDVVRYHFKIDDK